MELLIFLFIGFIIYSLFSGTGSGDAYSSTSSQTRSTYVMGDLETKVQPLAVTLDDGTVLSGKKVMVRGFLNKTNLAQDLQAVLTLYDVTDRKDPKEFGPLVLTDIADIQETKSRAALIKINLGKVDPYNGYTKWVEFQRILPDFLITPKKGTRKIKGIFRLIPNTQKAIDAIHLGQRDETNCPLFELTAFEFEEEFKALGYQEAQDNVYKIKSYSVQLAIAVAFSDGSIDEGEAGAIKKWITHQIDIIQNEDQKNKLKKILNESFKKSFEKAKNNDLSVTRILRELKKITTKAYSISTLEFLFRVIEVDGKIDEKELAEVNRIGKELGVSLKEIKDMTDKAFLNTKNNSSHGDYNTESILGLNDDMTRDEKVDILKAEFKKWNGRIQNLPEGDEKEKAQKMLDTIAELRTKYG